MWTWVHWTIHSEAGSLRSAPRNSHVCRVLLPWWSVSRRAEVLQDNLRPRLQWALLIGQPETQLHVCTCFVSLMQQENVFSNEKVDHIHYISIHLKSITFWHNFWALIAQRLCFDPLKVLSLCSPSFFWKTLWWSICSTFSESKNDKNGPVFCCYETVRRIIHESLLWTFLAKIFYKEKIINLENTPELERGRLVVCVSHCLQKTYVYFDLISLQFK